MHQAMLHGSNGRLELWYVIWIFIPGNESLLLVIQGLKERGCAINYIHLGHKCMDMHFNHDLSLSEIADEIGISRQGVHDFIKRGRAVLSDYEKKLGLMARFCEIKKNLKNIQEDLQLIDRSELHSGNLYMLEQIDKNLVNVITKI